MAKYGHLEGLGGYRYSPSTHPPPSHTPGTPPLPPPLVHGLRMRRADQLKVAVGLKSVDQLTLSPLFSVLRGITEGYNLLRIDNR